jgi:membrane-bound lytic murein transglycosylase D
MILRKQIIKARKKDSLASVAKRYKVSVNDVAMWNKISVDSPLKSGQKLVLMLPSKGKSKAKNKKSSQRRRS